MLKNELGNTNIYVTPVGFGVMTINKYQLDLPLDEGADLIRYALERGVNFFDTAQYYETYHYIRAALKLYRADPGGGGDKSLSDDQTNSNIGKTEKTRPVISSKSLCSSFDDMRFAVEEALREMDIDCVDIFLLHEVRADGDFESREGAWKYLQEAKKQGLVKAIGVSTHYIDVAEKMTDIEECDVVFPLINYVGLGIRKGNGKGTYQEMASAIEKLDAAGKGVFGMKAFGGGNLTGSYLEALDYVSGLKGVDSIMIGIGNKSEVDRMVEYAEGTIDRSYIPDISNKKIYINQGDCEGCGSCMKACPNKALYWNENGLADVNHDICITCGYCAPACPVRAIVLY